MASASSSSTPTSEYKVLIIGGSGVGKTSYVNKLMGNKFTSSYIPTSSVDANDITFHTNLGQVTITVWDIAASLPEWDCGIYYVTADAAIIMYDVTSHHSYKTIVDYYQEVIRLCGNIPMVLVGNKSDVSGREIKPTSVNIHRRLSIPYYEISAKSGHNYQKPLVSLIRTLLDDDSLHLI